MFSEPGVEFYPRRAERFPLATMPGWGRRLAEFKAAAGSASVISSPADFCQYRGKANSCFGLDARGRVCNHLPCVFPSVALLS